MPSVMSATWAILKPMARVTLRYKRTDSMIKLNGPHSVIGRALIVHAKPDDFKTQQPPGNAGDRIGCGVIGIGDPKMMMH